MTGAVLTEFTNVQQGNFTCIGKPLFQSLRSYRLVHGVGEEKGYLADSVNSISPPGSM